MHRSAYVHMEACLARYCDPQQHKVAVDIGSRAVSGQALTHRSLCEPYKLDYIGVDVVAGPNVDVVMTEPYRLPLESASADVVLCGQVMEHVPFFWVTFLEMVRVTRANGIILVSVPSRGHRHSPPTDCWRFYPDGMLALAKFGDVTLLHAHTDFPRKTADGKRLDYATVTDYRYWGDTVGVFRKENDKDSAELQQLRDLLINWVNVRNDLKPGVAPQKN